VIKTRWRRSFIGFEEAVQATLRLVLDYGVIPLVLLRARFDRVEQPFGTNDMIFNPGFCGERPLCLGAAQLLRGQDVRRPTGSIPRIKHHIQISWSMGSSPCVTYATIPPASRTTRLSSMSVVFAQ